MIVFFNSARPEVTHVLFLAYSAAFEVCIAMKLCHVLRQDTTLAMKSINILADKEVQLVLILELNKSHVRQ